MNVLLQNVQGYGRSPFCVLICFCKSVWLLNALLQVEQQYGHSPVCVCVIMCLTKMR